MKKPVLASARIALAAGLVMMAGQQAEACEFAKIAELHVTVENNQILIPGTIGGKTVKFLFDTSYSASLIPEGAARRLDVPVSSVTANALSSLVGGNVNYKDNSFAEVPKLTLDGFEVKDTIFRVFGGTETTNFGSPDSAVLLGADFWKGYDVEVDLSHKLVSLYRTKDCAGSNLAYWSNAYNMVDLQRYGAQTVFSVQVDGHDLSAVLDSGSAHTTLTDKAAARIGVAHGNAPVLAAEDRENGAQAADLPALMRIGYGLGLNEISPNIVTNGFPDTAKTPPRTDYWLARFKSLSVDQETISPYTMRVVHSSPTRTPETGTLIPANEPGHFDVLLGVDFLMSHRVLIANSQNKMYFTFTGGTSFAKPS